MKRTTTQKKETQKNTLLSYFASTKAPPKKEPLSSLIDKTNPHTIKQTASNPSKARNQKRQQQPIDMTNDADDSDDIIMISSQQTVIDLESSQSSFQSTSSSQSSTHRLNTTEMVNNSKYNRKGWSVEAKQRGPLSSSQDSRLSQSKKPSQQFERLQLNKPRITAKPSYEWLGPNDVKPYSSNFSPFVSAADHLKDDAPRVTSQFERSNSQPYISSSSGGKRGWTDYDDSSSSTSSYGSSWSSNSLTSSKRRTLPTQPTRPKDTNWSKTKAKPGYGRQAHAKVSYDKPMVMSQMASLSPTASTEFTPELSDEQKRVFDMVVRERKSIFFTGSAGTGKSVLLRAIIAKLRSTYGSRLAVTASTGIAACNINGCTLHSFGGIGIGAEKAEELAAKVEFNRRSSERWKETDVLIIDEISMVDAELFDKMDYIAKRVRHTDAPFGGIQIVVTGDFFQLPPVNKERASKFAFEAESWRAAISRTVLLTQVFRQKDGTFVRILNEMRLGILSEEAISIFSSLSRAPAACDDIQPTELYPLRNEVDDSNRRRLTELRGEEIEYKAIDEGDSRKLQQCIAPTLLHLKLHAQVMLLKNMDAELVNGSLGVVVGFVGRGNYRNKAECEMLRTPQRKRDRNSLFAADKEGDGEIDMDVPWPVVKFANGREMILEREAWSVALPGGRDVSRRRQLPLMLAWAISIHKSQGQTLDAVRVDLGKVFEKGQAYVALSRATSLKQLQILNFDPAKVMAHPTVSNFYRTLQTFR
ncbi:uncharacterized protein ATC70_006246 [Mucor velutinosus]|uniref:ATP-dependent DNA helicase PIF1 n=1 Tax=Mucor velutinosus TaxID=708070 RepID=A0AAN7D3L5_9FUNG|nr:hypothetical protein ATC70_006246 [Mucor velutinosus]